MNFYDLQHQILKGAANGKTIWQPRINCWYEDREYTNQPLPPGYTGLDRKGLYEKLGVSDRLYQFNACFKALLDDSIRVTRKKIDDLTEEIIMTTPVGTVNQVVRGNLSNPGRMPVKWFVETEEDLETYIYIEEHTTWRFDQDTYDRLFRDLGHLGLPAAYLCRTNIQHLIVSLAGVENTYYLLADCPDTVEAYFDALSKSQEGYLAAVLASPLQWLNYGDNIHCKILPPSLLKKYVIPEYEKRRDIVKKERDVFLYSHFDGDLRDYLPLLQDCALDGFEALTPQPQGDVTVDEMIEALGPDLYLVDGVAALLFSDLYPVSMLKDQVNQLLNRLEGRLILGISDELPSDGLLERVFIVRDMVADFNARR